MTSNGHRPDKWRRRQVTLLFAWTAFLLPDLYAGSLEDAADLASGMNSSNVFWAVLAVLLGGGCIYYLFLWLYLQKVQQHQERLKALYMLAEGLLPTDRPSTILSQIADVIPSVSDATHCSVWILDPSSQKLEYGAGSDKRPSSSVSLSAIDGVVTCFRNQAVTEVTDAEDCPFVNKETVRRLGQKALLYVPIIADRVCLGVIEIEDRNRKRIFPNEQKAAVEHVAKLAALALWQRAQHSLKDQMHRSEKLAAMSEFMEGVGDELIQPLATIQGIVQGHPKGSSPEEMSRYLEVIGRETQTASEALARLVKFAQPRPANLEILDINALLTKLTESMRQRWKDKGFKLTFEQSKASPCVTADPDQMEEILTNVFRQAEELLQDMGCTSLEVYADVLDREVLISMTPGGSLQRTSASLQREPVDPEEEAERTPGLGLAVCRSLIEGAGGALRLDHATSRGFRIEIEYPLTRESWSGSRPSPVQERESHRTVTSALVLVIDDDRTTQDALLQRLTDRGHRTVVATTIEEGVDLAQRAEFDWLFCKIQIGRLSALEIHNRLRGQADKFVFLADEKTIVFNEEIFSAEDRFVLRKPVRGPELETLMDALGARPTQVHEGKPARV